MFLLYANNLKGLIEFEYNWHTQNHEFGKPGKSQCKVLENEILKQTGTKLSSETILVFYLNSIVLLTINHGKGVSVIMGIHFPNFPK